MEQQIHRQVTPEEQRRADYIRKMKEDIKVLAAEQRILKPQRKTIHFTGERTYTPSEAVHHHHMNRYDLHHMYGVYAYMRGKEVPGKYDKNKIIKLSDEYGITAVYPGTPGS